MNLSMTKEDKKVFFIFFSISAFLGLILPFSVIFL